MPTEEPNNQENVQAAAKQPETADAVNQFESEDLFAIEQAESPVESTESAEPGQGNTRPVSTGGRFFKVGRQSVTAFIKSRIQPLREQIGRLSPLHVILGLNTVLIVILILAVISWNGKQPDTSPGPAVSDNAKEETAFILPPQVESKSEVPQTTDLLGASSWQTAEKFFAGQQYDKAYAHYWKLLETASSKPSEILVSDLLRLRVAQCLQYQGYSDRAKTQFEKAAQSRSGIIRAMANYNLAVIDAKNGQYFYARMRAYQGIAALGCFKTPQPLETDCEFLVARAITAKILSYKSTSESIPWGSQEPADPFEGLNQLELHRLIKQGVDTMDEAVLGPRLQKLPVESSLRNWRAAAFQAPIEELLNQLATETGLDLKWENVDSDVRRRAITIDFAGVSDLKLGEVACGTVGLLVRFTGDAILVYNPQAYDSMSEQKQLMMKEAVSVWQRFFLHSPKDRRIGLGHYCLAAIHENLDDELSALREYQVIANRFRKDEIAPMALLRCATIRMNMMDYQGARSDLLDLFDMYPHFRSSDQVHLKLAQATMQAGLLNDAIEIFSKLYHLNLSRESQMQACLGAGKCLWQKKMYQEARTWFTRYLGLSEQEINNSDTATVHQYLARCHAALGDMSLAVESYRRALACEPPEAQRVEIVIELGHIHLLNHEFVQAIGILDNLDTDKLSERNRYEIALLTAQVYQEMGLANKAAAILRLALESDSISDTDMQASLAVQLANCYADVHEYTRARNLLAELLPSLKPGPLMYIAKCNLAKACLDSGESSQAITVAKDLINSKCPGNIRDKAREILGAAYTMEQEYEKAAMAFSGIADHKGTEDK